MSMKDNFLVVLFTIIILIVFGFTYFTLLDMSNLEFKKVNQQFWYLSVISIGLIVLIILVFWAARRF